MKSIIYKNIKRKQFVTFQKLLMTFSLVICLESRDPDITWLRLQYKGSKPILIRKRNQKQNSNEGITVKNSKNLKP